MSLKLTNVGIVQDDEVILENITYEFEPGKIYVVMGRTTAGKTSLMRAISGLADLTEGEMWLNDVDLEQVPIWQRKVSMVYQQFINYPNQTVLENVQFPLLRAGVSKAEARTRAQQILETVGLSDFQTKRPGQLSGGQQQRVAIARALIRNADVLLLDEPLMNLDYKLREQLREEFRDLFTTSKNSITLYATTEASEALLIGDELLIMHEGRLVQHGKPAEIFENPNSVTVAQIVNEPPMSILSAKIADKKLQIGNFSPVAVPKHLAGVSEGQYQVGMRASEFLLAGQGSQAEQATVSLVEVSGSETLIYANTSAGETILQQEGIHDYHIGAKVGVQIPAERVFLFDTKGDLLVAPGN